ncbi:MAG: hypothetical protein HYV28_18245 [Ignavibacteriales bacterium]|nr:hypothetical protein [Ignavibacteriales bacterium]
MKNISEKLSIGFKRLGLYNELGIGLFFVSEKEMYSDNYELWFHLEKGEMFGVTAIFFRETIGGRLVPQVYIYDYTIKPISNINELTDIHRKIWTSGDIPIVCIFTSTHIKILDTSCPIEKTAEGNFVPAYLIDNLSFVGKVHQMYNEHFFTKIKTGTYWDDESVIVSFKKSSYDLFIEHLKKIIHEFVAKSEVDEHVAQKLIIQSILIKYLEERVDPFGNRVFPNDYFNKYSASTCFCDILRQGLALDFFKDLNDNHFNGGIFSWDKAEELQLKKCNFEYLADALDGKTDGNNQYLLGFWKLYSFEYIPIELISRLYEEFLIKEVQKTKDGATYTPFHLTKLLINEISLLILLVDRVFF